MANLTTLRQDVGKALRECVTGYVDAVTDTTIQDNDLIDPIEAESLYTGAWLYIISGNGSTVEGHILRYNPSSGLLTLSRPLLPTPEVSDPYEIHTLIRPTILNELIQEAVSPLYYEGGLEYGIYNHPNQLFWGVPFTDAPGHVLSVVNRAAYTDDVTEAEEYPVIWSHPFRNEAGNVVLRIEPGSITDPNGHIVIRYLKLCGAPQPTGSIRVRDEYAKCASLVKCYEYLMRSGPAQDVARWERLLIYEQTKLSGMHRKFGPRGRVVRFVAPPLMGRLSS